MQIQKRFRKEKSILLDFAEVTGKVDDGSANGIIYLDFQSAGNEI